MAARCSRNDFHECPSSRRRQIEERRGVHNDERELDRSFRDEGSEAIDQVTSDDTKGVSLRQSNGSAQVLSSSPVLRPEAGGKPTDRLGVIHVHRCQVDSRAPRDTDLGGDRRLLRQKEHARELQRRRPIACASHAVVIAVTIRLQQQTG